MCVGACGVSAGCKNCKNTTLCHKCVVQISQKRNGSRSDCPCLRDWSPSHKTHFPQFPKRPRTSCARRRARFCPRACILGSRSVDMVKLAKDQRPHTAPALGDLSDLELYEVVDVPPPTWIKGARPFGSAGVTRLAPLEGQSPDMPAHSTRRCHAT